MTTQDEPLNLFSEGSRLCTRFRLKQNTTSVYLRLESSNNSNPVFVKIVGYPNEDSEFVNYTYYGVDHFMIFPGKKYMLYNDAPSNSHVRLEFDGADVYNLKGVWSPDSVHESGCETIGPEYKKSQSGNQMNTKDEPFSFDLGPGSGEKLLNYRDKFSSSSVYLNLSKSNFPGVVKCRIYGKNPSSGETENCTYKTDYFLIESGYKYEIFNYVKEKGFAQANISFQCQSDGKPIHIEGLWSPDYVKESGVVAVGKGSGRANTKDTPFEFSNFMQCVQTELRYKATFSSCYLKIDVLSSPIKLRVLGSKNNQISNETNRDESYIIYNPGKYELYNSVLENRCDAAKLEFEPLDKKSTNIKGVWSPDYIKDPECTILGSSTASGSSRLLPVSNPTVHIQVPFISQQGIPTGCEAVSSTMVLQFMGVDIQPYDFIARYLPKVPVEYRPDPNCVFVGNPYSKHAFGCFAPCIAKTCRKIVDESKYQVIETTGNSLSDLLKKYIDKGVPVIIWATMGMLPTKFGSSTWKIHYICEGAKYKIDDTFKWPGNEHCLALVGYNNDFFIVNDPLAGIGMYPKNILELRFKEQGSMSVVILKRTTYSKPIGPEQFKFTAPTNPPEKPKVDNNDSSKRILKGIDGALKITGGVLSIAAGFGITTGSGGLGTIVGYGSLAFGVSNTAEGIMDILSAIQGNDMKSPNLIRDFIFRGNQKLYDVTNVAFDLGAGAIDLCTKRLNVLPALFMKNTEKTEGKIVCWWIEEEGMTIYGRKYSPHALERMAPNTDEVKAAIRTHFLKRDPFDKVKHDKALVKAWEYRLKDALKPRNIPPMVVEDIIQHETKLANFVKDTQANKWVPTPDKWRYARAVDSQNGIAVIVNEHGDVVTVFHGRIKDAFQLDLHPGLKFNIPK